MTVLRSVPFSQHPGIISGPLHTLTPQQKRCSPVAIIRKEAPLRECTPGASFLGPVPALKRPGPSGARIHGREPGPTASAAPSPLSAQQSLKSLVHRLKVTGDLLVGSGDTGLAVTVPLGWLRLTFSSAKLS